MSNSLWPQGLQCARLPCPSLSHRVCSNPWLLSQWCYLSNHLILCWPLFLFLSIFPGISNESVLPIRWLNCWSFSFSFRISAFNEYSGWISFRIDWFDLLAFRGTLKSLLQDHSSKASWHSAFFFFFLNSALTSIHDYWKTHNLDHMGLCQQSDISVF